MKKIFFTAIVTGFLTWLFLQEPPVTASTNIGLNEFVNKDALSKKSLMKIYNMGGTFTIRNGVANTVECTVNTGHEPDLSHIVVSLPTSYEFDKWLLNVESDKDKSEHIEEPINKGMVSITSNMLKSSPAPVVMKLITNQLVKSTNALTKCYENLARQQKNEPLLK